MTKEEIQNKAQELGHCLCSKLFKCPCRYYQQHSICHCAGEITGLTFAAWIDENIKTP
jgi:hypothetical protein